MPLGLLNRTEKECEKIFEKSKIRKISSTSLKIHNSKVKVKLRITFKIPGAKGMSHGASVTSYYNQKLYDIACKPGMAVYSTFAHEIFHIFQKVVTDNRVPRALYWLKMNSKLSTELREILYYTADEECEAYFQTAYYQLRIYFNDNPHEEDKRKIIKDYLSSNKFFKFLNLYSKTKFDASTFGVQLSHQETRHANRVVNRNCKRYWKKFQRLYTFFI